MGEGARFTLAMSATPEAAAAGSAQPPADALDVLGLWQRAPAQAASSTERDAAGEHRVGRRGDGRTTGRLARRVAFVVEGGRCRHPGEQQAPVERLRGPARCSAAHGRGDRRRARRPGAAAFQAGPLAAPTPGSPAPFETPLEAAPDAASAASGQPAIPPLTPEDELLLLLGQISNESARVPVRGTASPRDRPAGPGSFPTAARFSLSRRSGKQRGRAAR